MLMKIKFKIRRIQYAYYDIKYGIRNLIKWAPTIWKLRDWDAHGIYSLLATHLRNAEECERGHKIRTARILAERLDKQGYLSNALAPVETKYGESKFDFIKSPDGKYYTMVDLDTKEHSDKRHRAYKHSNKMEAQDREMLFKLMNKYIKYWWD